MLRHNILRVPICRVCKGLQFTNIRDFHLSHCVLRRRVRSIRNTQLESRTTAQVQSIAEQPTEPQLVNVNNNFYGIESDEGVINVAERSACGHIRSYAEKSFTNKSSLKMNSDIVKTARFGSVRSDEDNKIIFHGQYEDNQNLEPNNISRGFEQYNSSFPSPNSLLTSRTNDSSKEVSCNNMDVTKHSAQKTRENSNDEIISNINKKDHTSFIDEVYFPNQTMEDKSDCKSDKMSNFDSNGSTSFIDKFYFPNHTAEDRNSSVMKNSSGEFNFIDQESLSNSSKPVTEDINISSSSSFVNKIMQNEFNPDLNSTLGTSENVNQITLQNSIDFKLTDEINSIDNSYSKKAIEDDDVSNILATPDVHLKEKNIPVFEKNELCRKDENVNEVSSLNSDINIAVATDKNSHDANRDKSNSFQHEQIHNHINFDAVTDMDKKIGLKSKLNRQFGLSEKVTKHNKNVSSSNINFIQNELNSGIEFYDSKKEPNEFIDSTEAEFNVKVCNLRNQKSSVTDNGSGMEYDANNLIKANMSQRATREQFKTIGRTSEMQIESNKYNTKQSLEQKADEENQNKVNTAFEFVSKLRNEKKQVQQIIKGGKILPGSEKLDSKGFRILRNQIPNLMSFTREEILNLLKNNILYSDEDILVLNKPYNMVIHESQTTKDLTLSQFLDELAIQLDQENKNPKLLTVHRIDKETCGCLLLARNEDSAERLKTFFAHKKIVKTYWIVTIAVPDPLKGIIDIPIAEGSVGDKQRMVLHPNIPKDVPYVSHAKHGKRAVTDYKVVAQAGNAALVEVQPVTGIKHQIRVHFGFGLSCPILGDHKYSHLSKMAPQKLPSDMLQRLHVRQSKVRHIPMHIYARSIRIPEYKDGRDLYVMAPMPVHMSLNLQRLKFKKNN